MTSNNRSNSAPHWSGLPGAFRGRGLRGAVALLTLLTLLSAGNAHAQCFPDTLLQTIPNPSLVGNDLFGASVAVSGNVAVVGAYLNDTGSTNAGRAYIYDPTTGTPGVTLSNPAPAINDSFGGSVAISGNVVVVGAHGDNFGANDSGTAYVFDATTGALAVTLDNPTPAADDYFGYSVAVSGNVVVVGAYNDDTGATDSGSAYIFDATTGALVATLNNPAPGAGDFFGASVAVSGNVAVVGAYGDDFGATDSGTAYVFDATTGALVATLNNPARIVKILPYLEEG